MKIKVIERGETEFTASTEWTEPEIRRALASGDVDGNLRSAVIDTTDMERDTDTDEYVTVTEDDGTVLWAGWLTGDKDKPAPDAAPTSRGDPATRLLALPLPGNDSGASTVRGYLVALLRIAWEAGDGIHPFGNSGWQHDLYHPMTEAGLARIGYDEDGYATESEAADSYVEANALILAAIAKLGEVTP